MPIYNGTQNVAPMGISKAYVGNVLVYQRITQTPLWLYIGGHKGTDPITGTEYGSYPNRGTITYTNIYNHTKTIDIATLVSEGELGKDKNYRLQNIKPGSDVICEDIGLYVYGFSGPSLYIQCRFTNTWGSYDYSVRMWPYETTTASYTFENVQVREYATQADVVIDSTAN